MEQLFFLQGQNGSDFYFAAKGLPTRERERERESRVHGFHELGTCDSSGRGVYALLPLRSSWARCGALVPVGVRGGRIGSQRQRDR